MLLCLKSEKKKKKKIMIEMIALIGVTADYRELKFDKKLSFY